MGAITWEKEEGFFQEYGFKDISRKFLYLYDLLRLDVGDLCGRLPANDAQHPVAVCVSLPPGADLLVLSGAGVDGVLDLVSGGDGV